MAYDYSPRAVEQWTFEAQAALWRERALHQAQRAEFFRKLSEAVQTGGTIKPSATEPSL